MGPPALQVLAHLGGHFYAWRNGLEPDSEWASQILFTGELVDAETALRIGLVNELHPADAVVPRALNLAETMASRSQVSVRGAKTIITRTIEGHHDEDETVHALYEASVTSADYAEGVRAFLEKRPPRF